MSKESILRRCAAVRELAEHGAPGEREAAEAKLYELMDRHGITDFDLESRDTEMHWFRYRDAFERTLLTQVIVSRTTSTLVWGRPGNLNQYGVKCTKAEKLEIELDFEFYLRAAQVELEFFWRAFFHKHRMYPDKETALEGTDRPHLTTREIMKLLSMESALDTHTRPGMIGGGEDADG